jgi:hypothetical protein
MDTVFRPTTAMYRAKAILHRSCPPAQAVTLTPNEPKMHNLIRPTSLSQMNKWLETYGEEFWEWFITPPSVDGNEIQVRDKAYEVLLEIFGMSSQNEEGRVNYANLKLKLDAAKLLLVQKNPLVAIQNNVGEENIPRGLRGKTESQTEERLRQLTKYTQRQALPSGMAEDTIDAEME